MTRRFDTPTCVLRYCWVFQGREWGLLGLLYLLLQVVRSVVVVLLLPVLTKWGYGMTHKQLMVLAFAGLRGKGGRQ